MARQLSGYIERLKDGAVIAIDAPWGEGKSYFGRNWAKFLEDNGHIVVFIDAFEQDYLEDPFFAHYAGGNRAEGRAKISR